MSPLAEERVDQVRELLATGLSQRVVSRKTSVSRGTVGTIAAGNYRDYARIRKDRENARLPGSGPIECCDKCRRFVPMPCVVCAAWKARDTSRQRGPASLQSDSQNSLEPDLRDEHRAVYERIHAMKVRRANEGSPLQLGLVELDAEDHEQEEPPELAMLAESSPDNARQRLAAMLAMGPVFDRRARPAQA